MTTRDKYTNVPAPYSWEVPAAGDTRFTMWMGLISGGLSIALLWLGIATWHLALWAVPLAFVSVMMLGAILGMGGIHVPFTEQGIAASVLILGILIAAALRLPLAASVAIVALFALFHGYAHGAEMPATTSGFRYGIGFVAATVLLHACGIGLGLAAKKMANEKTVRYAGGAIAACGLYLIFAA